MNLEQVLINKWRQLPPEKQQQVIDFVSKLELNSQKNSQKNPQIQQNQPTENPNNKQNFAPLKGKITYYIEPYEPVTIEDWECLFS